ncbi:MMPL family transporter [Yinghuangia sp. ASG 101]|uniref:MMPL family transporter n=1 Tax=Yinghuangia sp. ASG 101 TaxID=2896848 RepID=UPI001E47DE42|nr:MMPL family transporter [Yinghuangia sp. ASG 101]UGQ09749.1 MMPL family transporter [Yinghuangia sp. ASG 101]
MNSWKAIAAKTCGRRSKWMVLAAWIIVVIALSPLSMKLSDAQNNETAAWLPGSAESTKVVDEQEDFRDETTVLAVVVWENPDGLQDADRAAIADNVAGFNGIEGVIGPVPAPSYDDDNKAAQALVSIEVAKDGWNNLVDAVDAMKEATATQPPGLKTYITGPAGVGADQAAAFEGLEGKILFATMGVVVVILLLTYRSPVLWFVPLLSAIFAMMSAWAAVYLSTKAGVTVNGQSFAVLNIMIFGAGTDYALLLIARYREELHNFDDRHEAMAHALHRAGPAIFASAATVAVSMLVLLTADMNSTQGMGPVCAIGIGVGVLVMLTLLPALLVIVGRWAFWPKVPRFGDESVHKGGIWDRVGGVIARRSRTVWVTTTVVLGIAAIGLSMLQTGGVKLKDQFTDKPESIVGMEVQGRYFAQGAGDPMTVIANKAQAGAVLEALKSVPNVDPPSVHVLHESADRAEIELTLTIPTDTGQARDTVEDIRDVVHAIPDADAIVGGGPALTLDMMKSSSRDNVVVIPLILIAVMIILCLLLRSILAPVLLVATVVLSFAAALGISAFVFDNVFGFVGGDPSLPLFVFVFLVALGIDYNIFLMHRVHEESVKHGTRKGALIGLSATGGVITSAGLVLAATFAVFTAMPLVGFVTMGFAVSLGVLLDTFIVRSVLVTALTHDIGQKIWWPSKLAKETAEPEADPDAGERDRELVG